ncbi:MAG: hypothetical protein ACN6QH_26530 [Pseudomonas sp.]|uniref:hypothetical protein n=1 Tax=Pseudomonas sp. TaxID=306 RepID=UPI003D0BCB24
MTRRNFFRLIWAITIACWGFVALSLNIERECNPVDNTCAIAKVSLGQVPMWTKQAPGAEG